MTPRKPTQDWHLSDPLAWLDGYTAGFKGVVINNPYREGSIEYETYGMAFSAGRNRRMIIGSIRGQSL